MRKVGKRTEENAQHRLRRRAKLHVTKSGPSRENSLLRKIKKGQRNSLITHVKISD